MPIASHCCKRVLAVFVLVEQHSCLGCMCLNFLISSGTFTLVIACYFCINSIVTARSENLRVSFISSAQRQSWPLSLYNALRVIPDNAIARCFEQL